MSGNLISANYYINRRGYVDNRCIISVIITCYNLENFVSRAINSCLNQTLHDSLYEIIVVDDCSTDDSWDVISSYLIDKKDIKYSDPRHQVVRAVRHLENRGVSAASNTGIHNARGKYIVRVDADDYIDKNFLFSMTQILDWNDDIGFVYCDHIIIEEDKTRYLQLNTLDKLLDHGAGVAFRKKYLESLGLYNEQYRNREDYDLILRYIKNFDSYHLRLPYYKYVKRDGSLTTDLRAREKIRNTIDKKVGVSNERSVE